MDSRLAALRRATRMHTNNELPPWRQGGLRRRSPGEGGRSQ